MRFPAWNSHLCICVIVQYTDAVFHCSQQAAHIIIMPVLVFIHAQAAYVLAEWTWATAVQYKWVLFDTGFYTPLFLSHVPLSCEKWFGTAGAQSKILHWKEMKLVFVRQTRVPAVNVRLELTAGVEYICLGQRVKLYFVWCWPNWC